MIKGIIEVLQTEMLDFTAPVLINNLPSIDGCLCSQRQVIWGMKQAGMTSDKQFYKMLKASGRIFDYYILGDMPLCGVMKNMGNNYVLNKYLMPKGSFGNKNLRDGTGSAPRYIECKLDKYSEYMLEGINKSAVTMKKNYDATEFEPVILPSKIPNILTNCRMSISVSESNKMPSHNINDTCDSLMYYLKTNDIDKAIEIIKTPDLPSGGAIIYNKQTFDSIYKTGRGSFINIGKYKYDKKSNTITIYEIPYTTYIENIEDELEKNIDKFSKELVDYHNGSDREGLKLELYLKKNVDVSLVIQKLRKFTSYKSKFACNFTILDLDGKTPKLMSLQKIYDTWLLHRNNCIKNETQFDINKNNEILHKLYGLRIINADLDNAIKIIRSSKKEAIAIQNLINHYNISQIQSEYIVGIRLGNINEEWIKIKLNNITELENCNLKLNTFLNSEDAIKERIIFQLEEVKQKFGKDRVTEIIYDNKEIVFEKSDLVEDYNPTIVLTSKYIKKTRKYSDTQKLTEDDSVLQMIQCNNKDDILIFTNRGSCLSRKVYELQDCMPSEFGTFISTWLGEYLQKDEKVIYIYTSKDWTENLYCTFENGNVSKMSLIKSRPAQNRQVPITEIYNTRSPLVSIGVFKQDIDILLVTQSGHGLIINTEPMTTVKNKNGKGVEGIKLDIKNMKDDKVIGTLMNVNNKNSITMKTEKGKENNVNLGDISPNEDKNYLEYINGSRASLGIILCSCRKSKDMVNNVEFNVI